MDEEPKNTSELIIFLDDQSEEHHDIRKVWYNNRFYFSVVDIVTALKVSQKPPRQYWAQLKEKVKDEGFVAAINQIVPLRLRAADGRFRLTDCADQATVFRLIQSMPSKRVEPIKQWLAQTGSEKFDKTVQQRRPEAAFEQLVQRYIEQGYEPDWAWTRAQGDLVRNELTDEWEDRGAKGGRDFGTLTGIMHKETFGLLPSEHKSYKSVPQKEHLRDHLTIVEQGVSIFTETIGISLHRKRDTQGIEELQRDAHDAGKAGKQAREVAEVALGEQVVSSENYMHLKKVKTSQKGQKLKVSEQNQDHHTPDTLF